jgi:hypothetical protein
MIYKIDNYNIDIEYNTNDIVMQIDYENKIYQDVFLLEYIISKEPFIKTIDIVKKLINSCLTNKPNYNCSLSVDKTLKLNFSFVNDLQNINIIFELLPIRKDISNNQEIISLKKEINILKKEIDALKNNINVDIIPNLVPLDTNLIQVEMHYYYNAYLSSPINTKYTQDICFSDIHDEYIDLLWCYSCTYNTSKLKFINYEIHEIFDFTQHIDICGAEHYVFTKQIYHIMTTNNITQGCLIPNRMTNTFFTETTKYDYLNNDINKLKNINIYKHKNNKNIHNFTDEKFETITSIRTLYFVNVSLDGIIYIPCKTEKIVFINCIVDIIVMKTNNNILRNIEFYGTCPNNIDVFQKFEHKIEIRFNSCKIPPINKNNYHSNVTFTEFF